jgi:outer membrane protein, heavy metal efflux system
MTRARLRHGRLVLALAGAALAVSSGLASPPGTPAPNAPLSLLQLLDTAAANNPELAIARARSEAARGRLVQAGLYPNPTLTWEADDLGDPDGPAGTQGPIFSQQIVTAGKLHLAQAAAAYGVAAADWQATTRWYEVATRVRLAYYEALAAQEGVRASEDVVRLARDGLAAAEKLEKAGAGTRPDVLRARVELNESAMGLAVARERREAAWRLLATAVGVPALPAASLSGSLEAPPPRYDWQPTLAAVLTRSSEVQVAQAAVLQAEQLLLRAKAEAVPDVNFLVRPFYSDPDDNVQVKVEVGAALPIFNRNQGNIRTAYADLAWAQHEVRRVELSLVERLALAFQRYQAASRRAEAYEREVLRDAAESLRLVRLGYERGDPKYDYTTVLQAQRTLAQARLAYVQALGEYWRSAAEIAGLLQVDSFDDDAPATLPDCLPAAVLLPPRTD